MLPTCINSLHGMCTAGKANTISSWLTHSMTAATTSRSRKRSRREEEETPPRVSLEDLEQQDRTQQRLAPGSADSKQPQAAAHHQVTPGRGVADQPQVRPDVRKPPGGAVAHQPSAAAKKTTLAGKSSAQHHGQSSMTDFLTGAHAVQEGQPTPQHEQRNCTDMLPDG